MSLQAPGPSEPESNAAHFDRLLQLGAFYGRLPAELRAELARSAVLRVLEPEDTVLASEPLGGGIVVTGVVRLYLASEDGREVTYRYASAPAEFGLITLATLISGATLPVGVKAVTRCTFLSFDLGPVRRAIDRDGGVGAVLSTELAVRVVDALKALRLGVFESIRVRIARHLVDLAVVPTDKGPFAPVTQQTLADAVGTVREVVGRTLAEFRRAGWIETRRGGVLVLDRGALEQIVAENRSADDDLQARRGLTEGAGSASQAGPPRAPRARRRAGPAAR